MELSNALGRRKSAVARVYVNPGKGNITINDRTLEQYFADESLQYIVMQPLVLTNTQSQFDIKVNLDGDYVHISKLSYLTSQNSKGVCLN